VSTAAVRADSEPLVRKKPPPAIRRRRFLVAVANHSLLIAAAIAFLLPFVFITLTALMSDNQALSAKLWPHPFVWSNFTDVFTKAPIWRWTLNTMLYSGLATLGLLLSSIPVAYALSRLRWRGRKRRLRDRADRADAAAAGLGRASLRDVGEAAPGRDACAADHPELARRRLLDLPPAPVLHDDSRGVPRRGRVDGCGELRILTTVVVRLAKPAIAAVALFSLLYTFNDFFLPLLYTGENPHNWVLSIGLSEFRSLHQVQWNLTMAATLLVMAPVIVIFFLAQKVFVEGVTLTGVKG
jgi:multiple sugar transport system permease protein